MTRCRCVPSLLFPFLLLAGFSTRAQLLTNRTELQKASQELALQQKDLHVKLLSLARQKGWDLTLRGKKGKIAYLLGVDLQGYPVYVSTTDNIISAATIRTNKLWPGGATGLGLSGSSSNMKSKIAVWDEGEVRPTHVELTGRVTQVDGATNISDHSTHVAGTLVASGVNPSAKGMSFGAQQLLAYDFTNDQSEMAAAAAGGLLVSSHSYATIAGWYYNSGQSRWEFWGNAADTSDYKFGNYDKDTQMWDSIAYNAPNYLIVKAGGNNRTENGPAVGSTYWRYNSSGVMSNAGARPAGISNNDGYDIIATYGCAKNIITLGAVNALPGGYTQPSDAVLADFSSWGPTADGRIKPDLVADGVNVLSSIATSDNAYDIYSGTSMATPATAGSAFLLQEYYSKIHSGSFMRAATLKGLLIHTADETGASPGPDYQYGWGLINMQKAASVITSHDSDQLIRENNLVNGSHDTDTITVVASGTTPLLATIAWTDPPGNPNLGTRPDTTRKLVNDLDLRITNGATVYKPWVLNPFNRPAAATTGDNIRDNVEKVEVDSVIPGNTYKIAVSHKGILARGSQPYSLLVSGVGGQAYCASSSGGGGTYISNVSFSNINNTNPAGCHTYSDFTGIAAARLPVSQTVPIAISYLSCGAATTTNIAVYIDFNNNGVFTDPGELVLQNTSLLNSGTGAAVFNGNITIPTSVKIGSITRMRIVAQDNATLATPAPCGSYASGETQDYRVQFTATSVDVGITQLEYPTQVTCASDSQVVAVRIHNYGTSAQTNVPVTTTVRNGATIVATFNGTCRNSIPAGGEQVFTYGASFPFIAGTTYTFTSQTSLSGDLNTSNDQNTTTLTVNAASGSPSGTATICSATGLLKTSVSGDDMAFWYDTQTATTPIATGTNTSTTVIPSNNTYYLGLNDLKAKAGPATKLIYSNGAGDYFGFRGNYVKITTKVPLTIESARMYIGYPGTIDLTLATLGTVSGNSFTYFPVYSTTLNVAATAANPQPGTQLVPAGDNSDTGAIYLLNIPVPVPGDYIIIVQCQNSATAFTNVNGTVLPYPISLTGVISFTGTNLSDGAADSLTFPKKVYYPFYDMSIRLSGCPSPRVPVVAATPPSPVITLNGNVFTSSASSGNQWYRSGLALPGAINQTDTAIYSGLYKTVVTGATGCALTSNVINFTSTGVVDVNGSSIGLTVSPNPNTGVFQLAFYFDTQDDLSISLVNTLGQTVYTADYPAFVGQFSRQIGEGNLASGMYVLKIQHGTKTFVKKILVKR